MDNMHVELTKRAIERVLNIDDDPILFDENLLISLELGRGIICLPWLGTYETFDIPKTLDINNSLYDYLREKLLIPSFKQIQCKTHIFSNSMEDLINGYFVNRVNHFFSTIWRSQFKDECIPEMIDSSFKCVLNLYEEVQPLKYSDDDETLICTQSGYVFEPYESGYYIRNLKYDNDYVVNSLSGSIEWRYFSSLEDALIIVLNRLFNAGFRTFFNEIQSDRKYTDLLLN